MARLEVDGTPVERTSKSKILSIFAIIFFSILVGRLFYIQIVQGEKYRSMSVNNRVALEIMKASRGIIYDRNGIVLARNRPSYSVKILPYNMPRGYDIESRLLQIKSRDGELLFDSTDLANKLQQASYRQSRYTMLMEDVSMDFVSIIREHSMELPGIEVVTESRREYPLGEDIYHVIGYLGSIPEEQADSLQVLGYQPSDLIGKSGVEQVYENLLHGEDGIRYIEKNVYGRRLGVVEEMPIEDPVRGQNIYLTIDAELQQVAAQSFPDSLRGAVVVMDPRNGEVLAMVSKPSFNPNIFSLDPENRGREWRRVALDSTRPLMNRAVDGQYPPGSTFKLVSGLAFIDSNDAINEKNYMSQPCTASGYRIGNRRAHCWSNIGHGYLALEDAIKVSCNVYFYQGGLQVGDQRINEYSRRFGLGGATGIDLPHEKPGWLSGEELYNAHPSNVRRGIKWTRGLILNLAIGQAQIFTPLQLANMVAAISNGETRYTPFLLKEIRTGTGTVLEQHTSPDSFTVNVGDSSIASVKEGMRRVVMEPGGTGRRVRVPGIVVGGKSGSAEQGRKGSLTHALFVAAAPLDDPVIAIAVVVEAAGHGGAVAGPIAGDVLRYYFENNSEGQRLVEHYAALAEEEAVE